MLKIQEAIDNIRNLSEYLIPLTYPQNNPHLEDDIAVLKTIDGIDVDGYSVVIYFNRADYDDYYLETLQVYGKYTPFLPFPIVVKLALHILGGHELRFTEFYQDGRKMYCWTVCRIPLERSYSPKNPNKDITSFGSSHKSDDQESPGT